MPWDESYCINATFASQISGYSATWFRTAGNNELTDSQSPLAGESSSCAHTRARARALT